MIGDEILRIPYSAVSWSCLYRVISLIIVCVLSLCRFLTGRLEWTAYSEADLEHFPLLCFAVIWSHLIIQSTSVTQSVGIVQVKGQVLSELDNK